MNSVYRSHIQRSNLLSKGGKEKIGQACQASETGDMPYPSFLLVIAKTGNSTNADTVLLAHCAHMQGST